MPQPKIGNYIENLKTKCLEKDAFELNSKSFAEKCFTIKHYAKHIKYSTVIYIQNDYNSFLSIHEISYNRL